VYTERAPHADYIGGRIRAERPEKGETDMQRADHDLAFLFKFENYRLV
jgi:hypothetical protein